VCIAARKRRRHRSVVPERRIQPPIRREPRDRELACQLGKFGTALAGCDDAVFRVDRPAVAGEVPVGLPVGREARHREPSFTQGGLPGSAHQHDPPALADNDRIRAVRPAHLQVRNAPAPERSIELAGRRRPRNPAHEKRRDQPGNRTPSTAHVPETRMTTICCGRRP
jgi:hypothetical protein